MQEATTYYVDYKKYSYLYFVLPFVVAVTSYGTLNLTDWIVLVLLLSVAVNWLAKIFYFKWLRHVASIVVDDKGIETYSLTGEPIRIEYANLLGPFTEAVGAIKRSKFMDGDDATTSIMLTSLTEGYDDALALIVQHQQRVHGNAAHPA